jgi:hypothetical protein
MSRSSWEVRLENPGTPLAQKKVARIREETRDASHDLPQLLP